MSVIDMQIDPGKSYSKYEIMQLGVMGKTTPTVSKKILQDQLGPNLLKTKIQGKGRDSRYQIKGSDLIKYLEQV